MKGNVIYANARAKACETKILASDRLVRMIDCATADEAIKVLNEINFGEGVSIANTLEFEKLIQAEMVKFYDFVKEVCPDESLKKYLLLPADYANAQALIRAKYLKNNPAVMLTAEGLYTCDYLKTKINSDDYSAFPKGLAKALLTADNLFVYGQATGAKLDTAFNQALYEDLFDCAMTNSDLKEIFAVKVDAINVGIALRTRNYEQFLNMRVKGGKIPDKLFKMLCEEDVEVIKSSLSFKDYADLILRALQDFVENKPLSTLEKYADDYSVSYFKKTLYDTSSKKPFMLYCFYRLNEFKNVRIVMVGLINGFDKAQIKQRVRDCYAG